MSSVINQRINISILRVIKGFNEVAIVTILAF